MAMRRRELMLLGLAACAPAAVRPAAAEADAELVKMVTALGSAWSRGDSSAYAGWFSARADYVLANGTHLRGRSAIRQGVAALLAAQFKGTGAVLSLESSRPLGGGVRLAHVMTAVSRGSGPNATVMRYYTTMIITGKGDAARIEAAQDTSVGGAA